MKFLKFVAVAGAMVICFQGAATAGKLEKICKRKDKSNRCVEWVLQSAAGEAVAAGAKKVKDKVTKKCEVQQGGTVSNSTPAVIKC